LCEARAGGLIATADSVLDRWIKLSEECRRPDAVDSKCGLREGCEVEAGRVSGPDQPVRAVNGARTERVALTSVTTGLSPEPSPDTCAAEGASYDFVFCAAGDATRVARGDIAPRDAQAILKNVLVQNPLSQTQPCPAVGSQVTVDGVSHIWGDVDCGGDIGPRDAQAILKNVLGQSALSQTQPCPAVGSTVQVVG
jgi:hypothetical protein